MHPDLRVSLVVLCGVFVFLLCPLHVVSGLAGQPQPPSLLRELKSPQKAARSGTAGSQKKRMGVNLEVLRQLLLGQADTVLFHVAGEDVTLKRKRISRRKDSSTWVGTDPTGRIRVLLTIGRDHFFGRALVDGREFYYRPDPDTGECVIEERDPSQKVPLGDDVLTPPSAPAPSAALSLPATAAAVADDTSVIDVMVLYTSGLATDYVTTDLIQSRIQYLIDVANDSYINSNINTHLRLVYSQEVSYGDDVPTSVALDDLTGNNGVFADVETLRTQYGADQVTLLRSFVGEYCGLAWLMTGNDPGYAYAVVADGSYQGSYCDDLTYVHELGHNLGCAHDRDHAASGGIYPYSYGYQFEAGGVGYRTIMAYDCVGGCAQINYFSNPDVLYEGVATGVPAGLADAADNAATIEQTRLVVAGYRSSVLPALLPSARSHDFGSLEVGTNANFALYLSNNGTGNLEIGQISNPDAPFSIVEDNCSNQSIAAGEHCIVWIGCTPTAPGLYDSSFTVFSNDPVEPEFTMVLSATGQSTAPWITVTPTYLSFPKLLPGQTSDLSVAIGNLGLTDLQIGTIGMGDSLAPPFTLQTDTCSGQVLATDTSCSLTVRYAPLTATDSWQDSFIIPSTDPDDSQVTVRLQVRRFPWALFLPAILKGSGAR
ncbi:choice-of-anchor D domain-containing protein [Desulfolithobacter dissulfuricans]|nr:choice-of-anchor D domain-containing protein [Desulfolithobacter dissulfuricans]